jgi:hypothetical protein
MGSSYSPLRNYLGRAREPNVTLSFNEIEQILSRQLPASARRHRAWWANDRTHRHARTWLDVAWEVNAASLTAERITFRKVP